VKLAGRVAVVTGASRGIGLAIATAFEDAGAKVARCSRHGGGGSEVCDVGVSVEVARFADTVRRRWGTPDILVNNAGIVVRARLEDLTDAGLDEVLASNLRGTFLVTRAFLPDLRAREPARGPARIINIASISGRQGTAGLTAYCAAKHGVVGFTRALAEEVREGGILVNAICPGSVDTDMLRQGMPGAQPKMSPEDIARVALYLAADAPSAMTGSCLDVFG
jgi:NAD(P)-dependent dehydrogenase (short-subunit alcohol dehydrogenase family)